MAVVREFTAPNGATIIINDELCAGISPAEADARRKELNSEAYAMLRRRAAEMVCEKQR